LAVRQHGGHAITRPWASRHGNPDSGTKNRLTLADGAGEIAQRHPLLSGLDPPEPMPDLVEQVIETGLPCFDVDRTHHIGHSERS